MGQYSFQIQSNNNIIQQMRAIKLSSYQNISSQSETQNNSDRIQGHITCRGKLKSLIIFLAFIAIVMVSMFNILALKRKQMEEEEAAKKQKLYIRNFSQTPHQLDFHPKFKWYHKNHAHYQRKNNITSVLQINCQKPWQAKYESQQYYKQLIASFLTIDVQNNLTLNLNDKYDWINIHITKQIQFQHISFIIQKLTCCFLKGLTIFFEDMPIFKQFKQKRQTQILKIMLFYGFDYDEPISLSLRRRQGRILMVYSKNRIKSSFPFKKPMKNLIGIQVVVKIVENLPFFRQWIGYHMYLGVDKFFIYDNQGSLGFITKPKINQNFYGLNLSCLNYSQDKKIKQWQEIWLDYYEHIIYVPWQFKNKDGIIIYAQVQAQQDFIETYQDVTTYIGFIDPDQMMFSEKNLQFPQYLIQKSLAGFTGIRFRQKKFLSRFCIPYKRQIQVTQYFTVNTTAWGEKHFFQTAAFAPNWNVHEGKRYYGKQYIEEDLSQYRFNHYNMIETMITYSQNRFKSNQTRFRTDQSGLRYQTVMNTICRGKCSQKFKLICGLDNPKFTCPVLQKNYPVGQIIQPNIQKLQNA